MGVRRGALAGTHVLDRDDSSDTARVRVLARVLGGVGVDALCAGDVTLRQRLLQRSALGVTHCAHARGTSAQTPKSQRQGRVRDVSTLAWAVSKSLRVQPAHSANATNVSVALWLLDAGV